MAGRRSGRAISGWLVIDKPAGSSSAAVVNRVRRALAAQKAGHAGTLDPAATGVLAVALGEATKTVPHVADALKCYRFRVRFGAATDTDDAEGRVIATSPWRPGAAAIRAALPAFRGDILQVPPAYSAVKVDGARAYALARGGAEPELAARPLRVERLDLVGCPDPDHADLEMVCGKGGYVRAIARDLGAALGCPAHVAWLRRLWSGPFRVENGLSPEAIDRFAADPAGTAALDALLLPIESGLAGLIECPVPAEAAARLRNGNPVAVAAVAAGDGAEVWASLDGRAVAIGVLQGGLLHPGRVFLP
jgi:tRNA pseudouridine55 synthase